jgi:hypothetical protein
VAEFPCTGSQHNFALGGSIDCIQQFDRYQLTLHYKSEVHTSSLVTLSYCCLSLALGTLSVTKVWYTFFLLLPFHAWAGGDSPLKGKKNAAH